MEGTVEHRWCSDLGMFAIDRPIYSIKPTADRPGVKGSCVHRTAACSGCFNNKFYRMYQRDMDNRDVRNELSWRAITGAKLAKVMGRKRHQTSRVRLMTRGEAFRDPSDIRRVRDLCNANPGRVFWLPTRSWRNKHMRPLVRALQDELPNLRLQASTDVTTTAEEQAGLEDDGWSTMYWGDDDQHETLAGTPRHLCPKTWEHEKGACASTCTDGGCFSDKQTHVHLKAH
jgi:hypothetical protein